MGGRLARSAVAVVIASLLSPSAASAQDGPAARQHFFARGLVGAMAGDLTYHLQATVGPLTAESQLAWSATHLLAGAEVGAFGRFARGRRWDLSFAFLGSLTGPLGQMVDEDWYSAATIPRTELSYTSSRTEGSLWLFDASARLELVSVVGSTGALALDLVAGYRHEIHDLSAWGASGWQAIPPRPMTSVSLQDSIVGVTYVAHVNLPSLGLSLRADLGRVSLAAEARALVAVTDDVDDHVLRHKNGTASTVGAGVSAALRPRFALTPARSRVGVALGLDLQLRYFDSTGTLHQRYYAPDPFSPATVGTNVPDSDYRLSSLTGTALLAVDVSF